MDLNQIVQFSAYFINVVASIIRWAIIIRIILSWFRMGQAGPRSRIEMAINDITEPVIDLARKLPHRAGMFDFAPLIALIGVDLLAQLIIIGLYSLV